MTLNPVEWLAVYAFNRAWSTDPRGHYRPVFLGSSRTSPSLVLGWGASRAVNGRNGTPTWSATLSSSTRPTWPTRRDSKPVSGMDLSRSCLPPSEGCRRGRPARTLSDRSSARPAHHPRSAHGVGRRPPRARAVRGPSRGCRGQGLRSQVVSNTSLPAISPWSRARGRDHGDRVDRPAAPLSSSFPWKVTASSRSSWSPGSSGSMQGSG